MKRFIRFSFHFREKAKKHKEKIEEENKVVERASKIKKEKGNQFKWGNSAKNEKMKSIKQRMFLNDIKWIPVMNVYIWKMFLILNLLHLRQRLETKQTLDTKLELAQKRKETMLVERKIRKMQGEIDNFVKQSTFREQTLAKNDMLHQIYEEEQDKNLEVNWSFRMIPKVWDWFNWSNYRRVDSVCRKFTNSMKTN